MDVIYFIFQQTMIFTIPLMIVAIGGMFSERSGVINIALEGIMTLGAFAGVLFINLTGDSLSGQVQLIIALLISATTGIVFSLFHAYAAINMRANQVISGTALNMFAPAFAVFFARIMFRVQQIGFNNTFRIHSVPILGSIPVIGDLLFKNTYITTYLGIAIFVLSVITLYKTRFGLRLWACGEHPQAADAAGIDVYFMRYMGVIISGALAGIGGLIFIVPISTNFNATVAGYGFLALAVLIFGQWNPYKILYTSLFFGLMKAVSSAYSGIPFLANLAIPSYLYKIIPYAVTLLVLIFTSKKSMAPRAAGVPYDKGQR